MQYAIWWLFMEAYFKCVNTENWVWMNFAKILGYVFIGTAPLVPYLSTYARQLGFSSATVGLIYTVLPLFGLVAKPLFGVIADRFKIQKSIFILFQIVTIVSFLAIYIVPGSNSNVKVELDCDSGLSYIKSCYAKESPVDNCTISSVTDQTGIAECHMNCGMSSPEMWQTICEYWHMPEYCYSGVNGINYTAHLANITLKDQCAYMPAANVTLDGHIFTPHCRVGGDYIDLEEPCNLTCDDKTLSDVIGNQKVNMTCQDKMLNYRLCTNETTLAQLPNGTSSDCQAICDLDSRRLMEICEGWKADQAETCRPRYSSEADLPTNLSFTAYFDLSRAIRQTQCLYLELHHTVMPDGSTHQSNCADRKLFTSLCEIKCNNTELNQIFQEAADSNTTTQYTREFWLFFLLMIISWVGQAVVVTFADAICFNLLGQEVSQYGKQRLWGSVGWGIFSLLTGVLIDAFSEGDYKDYTVAFVLMFIFMSGDVIVSCFLKNESTKMSVSILADVGTLFSSLPTVIFFLWTIAVGLCTGLLWQFLFWHLEDIAKVNCNGSDYNKTLQGLVSAIQTFCGEIPFMFVSGYILKRMGHVNMMSLVLFAFGVRFILYSLLRTNPWWVLPIEMLQGITFGMFYPTMASFAKVVSPPGTETTVQGLVGAVFEGVGTSLGSFIGGRLYENVGGGNTFLYFGIGSLVFCSLHIGVQILIKDRYRHVGMYQGGYSSIIRYEQPSDMVCIVDATEGREMQLR